jgi:hypothetical protein
MLFLELLQLVCLYFDYWVFFVNLTNFIGLVSLLIFVLPIMRNLCVSFDDDEGHCSL